MSSREQVGYYKELQERFGEDHTKVEAIRKILNRQKHHSKLISELNKVLSEESKKVSNPCDICENEEQNVAYCVNCCDHKIDWDALEKEMAELNEKKKAWDQAWPRVCEIWGICSKNQKEFWEWHKKKHPKPEEKE